MKSRITLEARHLKEIVQLDPMLQKVVLFLLQKWPVEYMEVTSVRRTSLENAAAGSKSRIHVVGPPWRAIDIRIWNLGTKTTSMLTQKAKLCKAVNERFTYDPQRPVMVVAYGGNHGTAPHIHLQVHPNTVDTTS